MQETDLELLVDVALAAGDLAKQFVGPKAKRWEKPDGAGPVTEADLAVNRLLEDRLRMARPDYGWLSEESDDNIDRLTKERVFIVDPIDGTRSFAEGSRTWAHSLALVENGRPIAAVVFLPQRELMFAAVKGQGAACNGKPIRASSPLALEDAHVLSAKPTMESKNWVDGRVPEFRRSHRPSLAYRMARVADGSFDAMITLRPAWEWDIAAGDLILREAGAKSTDASGEELIFNSPGAKTAGVVAAPKSLHTDVISRLAANRRGIPAS